MLYALTGKLMGLQVEVEASYKVGNEIFSGTGFGRRFGSLGAHCLVESAWKGFSEGSGRVSVCLNIVWEVSCEEYGMGSERIVGF